MADGLGDTPRVGFIFDIDVRNLAQLERAVDLMERADRIHGAGGAAGAGAAGRMDDDDDATRRGAGGGGGAAFSADPDDDPSQRRMAAERRYANFDNAGYANSQRDLDNQRLRTQERDYNDNQRRVEQDERDRARARGEIRLSSGETIDDGSGRRNSARNFLSHWNPLSGNALGGAIAANFFGEFFGEMMAMFTMALAEQTKEQMNAMLEEGGSEEVSARGAGRVFGAGESIFRAMGREIVGLAGDIDEALGSAFRSETRQNAIEYANAITMVNESLEGAPGVPAGQRRAVGISQSIRSEEYGLGLSAEYRQTIDAAPQSYQSMLRTQAVREAAEWYGSANLTGGEAELGIGGSRLKDSINFASRPIARAVTNHRFDDLNEYMQSGSTNTEGIHEELEELQQFIGLMKDASLLSDEWTGETGRRRQDFEELGRALESLGIEAKQADNFTRLLGEGMNFTAAEARQMERDAEGISYGMQKSAVATQQSNMTLIDHTSTSQRYRQEIDAIRMAMGEIPPLTEKELKLKISIERQEAFIETQGRAYDPLTSVEGALEGIAAGFGDPMNVEGLPTWMLNTTIPDRTGGDPNITITTPTPTGGAGTTPESAWERKRNDLWQRGASDADLAELEPLFLAEHGKKPADLSYNQDRRSPSQQKEWEVTQGLRTTEDWEDVQRDLYSQGWTQGEVEGYQSGWQEDRATPWSVDRINDQGLTPGQQYRRTTGDVVGDRRSAQTSGENYLETLNANIRDLEIRLGAADASGDDKWGGVTESQLEGLREQKAVLEEQLEQETLTTDKLDEIRADASWHTDQLRSVLENLLDEFRQSRLEARERAAQAAKSGRQASSNLNKNQDTSGWYYHTFTNQTREGLEEKGWEIVAELGDGTYMARVQTGTKEEDPTPFGSHAQGQEATKAASRAYAYWASNINDDGNVELQRGSYDSQGNPSISQAALAAFEKVQGYTQEQLAHVQEQFGVNSDRARVFELILDNQEILAGYIKDKTIEDQG